MLMAGEGERSLESHADAGAALTGPEQEERLMRMNNECVGE